MITLSVNSVNDDPIIITTALPDGTVGIPYTFTMNATDIDSSILGWGEITTVDWLHMNANGDLSGTPTAAGTFQIDIVVNDGDGGIVRTNLTLVVIESAIDPGTDTDGDGIPDISDPDDDNDGTPDIDDAFPLDDTETTDTDGDGTGDNADAFPDDPAASVDADGDGAPDEWNDGYTADDSTTGLVLDDDVEDADADDDTGSSSWLYIIIILVVVGAIAGYLLMRGKGKEPVAEEPVEEIAPEETAPVEEIPIETEEIAEPETVEN